MIFIITAYIDAKYQMGFSGQYWGAFIIDVCLCIAYIEKSKDKKC